MILVANLVPSTFFFTIALGRMLLSCRVIICSAKTFINNHPSVPENFVHFTGKHLCWSLSLLNPEGGSEDLQLNLKETPAQVFS